MNDRKSWSKGLSLALVVALAWSGYALLWDADASVSDPGKCLEASVTPYAMLAPVAPLPVPWPEHTWTSYTHYYTSDVHYESSITHGPETGFHDTNSDSW